MIVDTSALMVILNDEPEASEAFAILEKIDVLSISAGTLLECTLVVQARFGQDGAERLQEMLKVAGVQVVPVDQDQVEIARQAYARYGKGTGAKAQLNFGDLFAYALSKQFDEPLLFKGQDFLYTDLKQHRIDGD